MARVLGHRQTKGAATDKPNLLPPRYIPTLPTRLAVDPHATRGAPRRVARAAASLDGRVNWFVSGRPPRVCAVIRRRFPVGESPTRQMLQPEVVGVVMEVTKWLKPSTQRVTQGDPASVQAVT